MKLFVRHVTGERRMARRFNVKVPLRYRLRRKAAEEQTSESENLSELGVSFVSDELLSVGAAIDVRMEVPPNLEGMRAAEWLCIGHVVRIEPNDFGSSRIGVEFDCYEVLDLLIKRKVDAATELNCGRDARMDRRALVRRAHL